MCDFSSPRLGFEPGTAASPEPPRSKARIASRDGVGAPGGSSFGDSADAPNEAAPFAVSQLTRLSLFTTAASTERRPRRPRLDMPPSSEGEGEGEGEGPLDRRGDALRDFARGRRRRRSAARGARSPTPGRGRSPRVAPLARRRRPREAPPPPRRDRRPRFRAIYRSRTRSWSKSHSNDARRSRRRRRRARPRPGAPSSRTRTGRGLGLGLGPPLRKATRLELFARAAPALGPASASASASASVLRTVQRTVVRSRRAVRVAVVDDAVKRGGPPRRERAAARGPRRNGSAETHPERARVVQVQRAGPGRNRAVFVPRMRLQKMRLRLVANARPVREVQRGVPPGNRAAFRWVSSGLGPAERAVRRERRRENARTPRWIRGGSRMFANGAGGCDGRVSSVRATARAAARAAARARLRVLLVRQPSDDVAERVRGRPQLVRRVREEARPSAAARAILAQLRAVSAWVQPALEHAVRQLARVPARARALAEVGTRRAAVVETARVSPTRLLAGVRVRTLRPVVRARARTPTHLELEHAEVVAHPGLDVRLRGVRAQAPRLRHGEGPWWTGARRVRRHRRSLASAQVQRVRAREREHASDSRGGAARPPRAVFAAYVPAAAARVLAEGGEPERPRAP